MEVEQFETWAGTLGDCFRELEGYGYQITNFEFTPDPPENYSHYPYGWIVTAER